MSNRLLSWSRLPKNSEMKENRSQRSLMVQYKNLESLSIGPQWSIAIEGQI